AYDTPEKICAIRRGYVEAHIVKLEQKRDDMLRSFKQIIGWRSSASPIQYEDDGKPGLYKNSCYECTKHLKTYKRWGKIVYARLDAERLCLDIVRVEEAIYRLTKDPLQAANISGDPFKP